MTLKNPPNGSIVWIDFTVPDADGIQDFYTKVVGWESAPHDMGEYHDFDIKTPEDGEVVTGICHTRDSNVKMPPYWMIYIQVEDVDASAARAVEMGGTLIDGPRAMGANRFACIQDPAGAYFALIA